MVGDLHDRCPYVREHSDVVSDLYGLFTSAGQCADLREGEHRVEEASLSIGVGHDEVKDLRMLGQFIERHHIGVGRRGLARRDS